MFTPPQLHFKYGYVNNIPTIAITNWDFKTFLSQNQVCYHKLSMIGNSKVMSCWDTIALTISAPIFK